MHNALFARASLTLGAFLLFGAALATAQDAPDAEASKVEAAKVEASPDAVTLPSRQFTIENVPVELLVWWLDSSHKPLPIQIQSSLGNGGELPRPGSFASSHLEIFDASRAPISGTKPPVNPYLSAPSQAPPDSKAPMPQSSPPRALSRLGNALGPLGLELPGEISIVSIEKKRNRFTARGPLASLDVLSELIRQIDVPLQQAEISMSLVEIRRDDFKTLGLEFPAKAGLPIDQLTRTAVTLTGGDGRALDELIASNAAKLLGTPRFLVLSGLTGKASTTERRSTILDYRYRDAPADSAPGFFFVEASNAFSCGAEVSGDLVALRIRIEWNNTLASLMGTVRDGQTLAIRLPSPDPNSPTVRIGFLTPRIVKRG